MTKQKKLTAEQIIQDMFKKAILVESDIVRIPPYQQSKQSEHDFRLETLSNFRDDDTDDYIITPPWSSTQDGERSADFGGNARNPVVLPDCDDSTVEELRAMNDVDKLGKEGKKEKDDNALPPDTLIGGHSTVINSISLPVLPHENESVKKSKKEKDYYFAGYDGGWSGGLEGKYQPGCLEKNNAIFDSLKEDAIATLDGKVDAVFCGRRILVYNTGANEGLHYKYRIEFEGIVFLIHHNPPKNRHAIRLRVGAEVLLANPASAVWQRILEFVNAIGFKITKDCISRVDFQVTTSCITMKELIKFMNDGHLVSKNRNRAIHDKLSRHGFAPGTITLGKDDAPVQICLYDKRKEIYDKKNRDSQKTAMVEEKMGAEWVESGLPATRIEIRIKRSALRSLGIKSMSDLFGNEWAIINLLTEKWLRILKEPKSPGNEARQKNHPVWDKIRSFFFMHFGVDNKDAKAEWKTPAPVSGNPELLEKQALGCLSKALAIRHGEQVSVESSTNMAAKWIECSSELLYHKINRIALHLGIQSGIPLGGDNPTTTIEQECLGRTRENIRAFFNGQQVLSESVDSRSPARKEWDDFMDKTKPIHMRFNE